MYGLQGELRGHISAIYPCLPIKMQIIINVDVIVTILILVHDCNIGCNLSFNLFTAQSVTSFSMNMYLLGIPLHA